MTEKLFTGTFNNNQNKKHLVSSAFIWPQRAELFIKEVVSFAKWSGISDNNEIV